MKMKAPEIIEIKDNEITKLTRQNQQLMADNTELQRKLDRSQESGRETEAANKALWIRCEEAEKSATGWKERFRDIRGEYAESEERYQNEIKRLNGIIDSIQGYVSALEVEGK